MIETTIVRGAHLGAVFAAALLSVPSSAQVVQFGVDVPAVTDSRASIVTNGAVAYTISTIDPFGTNPGVRKQIFRWDIATGSGSQVTSYGEGVENVSVSSDGTWLAFVSNADLLGTNHDESPELYVMRSDGTDLAQLTSSNLLPRPFPRGITRAVISGSANRIVFMGGINPLGTNPTLSNAVFVIDRDGNNLRQLDVNLGDVVDQVNLIDSGDVIDISDDGSKVIYEKANELKGINADGTGPHAFPSSINVREAAISGNGSQVVWAVGQSANGSSLRASTFVQPGTIVNLGGGHQPSITDDGAFVYYHWITAAFGIYRISSAGGSATLISSSGSRTLRVSGDGTRLLGTNSTGLFAMDNTGGNVQQLTQAPWGQGVGLVEALSPDGSRAWVLASQSPANSLLELSSYDFNTGTRTRLTDAYVADVHFRVSDAGDVVFASSDNPTGQNPGGTTQIFKIDAAGTISQLTSSPTFVGTRWPVIRGDGQEIVFQGATLTGEQDLYRMNGDGTGVTMVVAGSKQHPYAISEGTPAWVVYPSPVGVGAIPLFRVRTDGTGGQFITPNDPCQGVSISGDGNRVAFVSEGDFAGQNADHSSEVFLYDATTQAITQLTHDPGWIFETRITRDGQWVFVRDMKIAVDTGLAEPTAGFLHTSSFVTTVAPNVSGSAWAFSGAGIIDRTPNDRSLFRAVTSLAPKIQVGKESPTLLTWDASPGSLRYDVVRGSVANLTVVGSMVDLGPVSCLEDDSPDNHTLGHGDPADPSPGEAFFYVYRGSVGFNAAVGSYGQGTGGRERVEGAGGCNP